MGVDRRFLITYEDGENEEMSYEDVSRNISGLRPVNTHAIVNSGAALVRAQNGEGIARLPKVQVPARRAQAGSTVRCPRTTTSRFTASTEEPHLKCGTSFFSSVEAKQVCVVAVRRRSGAWLSAIQEGGRGQIQWVVVQDCDKMPVKGTISAQYLHTTSGALSTTVPLTALSIPLASVIPTRFRTTTCNPGAGPASEAK